METIARTFIIPSRQNQFVQDIFFVNAPITKIAVAIKSAVAGSFHEKLFNYQYFHLRELGTNRGARAIISLLKLLLVAPMIQQRTQCSLTKIFQLFL